MCRQALEDGGVSLLYEPSGIRLPRAPSYARLKPYDKLSYHTSMEGFSLEQQLHRKRQSV